MDHEFRIHFRELGEHAGGRSFYEDELDDELERLGLGEVIGGGTSLIGGGCDLEVSVWDAREGLRVIREVLARLNAPESTVIHGDDGEVYGVYG